ncbi:MAG: hypothetical protein ACYC2E_14415 [Sulfuricella sp.]
MSHHLHQLVHGQLLGQATGAFVAQIVEREIIEKSSNRLQSAR